MGNGADGSVLKWEVTRELLPAIEAALWGHELVTAHLTELEPAPVATAEKKRSGSLGQ